MLHAESRQSCAARMLDIRSYVLAARRTMIAADPSAAMFLAIVFGLIAVVLFPIWVSFDLLSTWEFTTGIRTASEPVIFDAAAYADGLLGMSVGAMLIGIIFTGFTLLPSLFELGFPAVNHPLLNVLLLASITFDYITDWPKAADVAAQWSTLPAVQFLYTVFFCAFVSVAVQALLALCITIVLFACIALLRGPQRPPQSPLTINV